MTTSELVRFVLSCSCTAAGLFAILSAVVGIFRFPNALSRIHAAALIDTAGMLFMLLGVAIGLGLTLTALKLAVIVCFLWITSPVASHLIGRLEGTTDDELEKKMTVEAPDMVAREKGEG